MKAKNVRPINRENNQLLNPAEQKQGYSTALGAANNPWHNHQLASGQQFPTRWSSIRPFPPVLFAQSAESKVPAVALSRCP